MIWAGIDLGGTQIKAGLVSDGGRLLSSTSQKTQVKDGYTAIVQQITAMVHSLALERGIEPDSIAGIGVGAPGTTSPEGLVYFANNLAWEDKPLQQDLEHQLKRPVYVENDASVAAMGELICGSLRGVTNGILLTLGTGLGSGLVVNGEVFSGSHGLGRQAGHMKVGENFYRCTCGGNGCLETFASATALVHYYREQLRISHGIHDQSQDDSPTARQIMEEAKMGNSLAIESVNRLIHYLGIGISNLINIMDPEVVALGGGLSQAGDQLMVPLRMSIKEHLFDRKRFYAKVVVATLENEAGMVGGAMFARRKINK